MCQTRENVDQREVFPRFPAAIQPLAHDTTGDGGARGAPWIQPARMAGAWLPMSGLSRRRARA